MSTPVTLLALLALHEQLAFAPAPSLGEALRAARTNPAGAAEAERSARWTQLLTHLLGDPELRVGPQAVATAAGPAVASRLVLRRAVPNPFHPSTTLRFELLGEAGSLLAVTVRIHDATGRHARTLWDGRLSGGPHQLVWDGRDVRIR